MSLYVCMYVCLFVRVHVLLCVWIGQETSEERKGWGGLLAHYKGQG